MHMGQTLLGTRLGDIFIGREGRSLCLLGVCGGTFFGKERIGSDTDIFKP